MVTAKTTASAQLTPCKNHATSAQHSCNKSLAKQTKTTKHISQTKRLHTCNNRRY